MVSLIFFDAFEFLEPVLKFNSALCLHLLEKGIGRDITDISLRLYCKILPTVLNKSR